MKKIIIGSMLVASCLFGDVTSVVYYTGDLKYDEDKKKSVKNTAKLYGVHMSIGSLSYLIEADYAKFTAKFKNTAVAELDQSDIALTFSKYFSKWMVKIGNHDINTNDPLLKDGNVIIAMLGGYIFNWYSKFSYGLEGYYSTYSNGQDELKVRKAINITQYTPYFSFFKSFSINLKNNISVKYNYQLASEYVKKNYESYEISDSIYYKNFFTTLKYYGGEMRTGVKDGGATVMNSLDLMKDGFDVKMGYYLSASAIISLSYGENNYQEYTAFPASLLEDGTNSVATIAYSQSF